MSSIARPPDPCLVAIILIVRSRTGPRLVFHWPPNPLHENRLKTTTKGGRRISRTRSRQGQKNTDSSSSDESGLSSDEDEEERERDRDRDPHPQPTGPSLGRRASNFGLEDHIALSGSPGTAGESQRPGSLGSGRGSAYRKRVGAGSDIDDDASDDGRAGASLRAPWESLLGLPGNVWEKLLSPSRSWHKRRFEVGINDLALVGWPVFVREDGTWRKQRRKKKKKKSEWDGGELGHNEAVEGVHEEDGEPASDLGASIASLAESVVSPTDSKRASTGWRHKPSDDPEDKDHMTMFNVVFVMDPPTLEYSGRVKEIYENVIKKFAKALKWEQARTDYVWKESQNILQMRRNARESRSLSSNLYSDLINKSSLARAIYTVYTSISASKISSVSLSPDVSISLQIPPLTSTSYVSGPGDKAYPGLWLTTADSATPVDEPVADDDGNTHHVLARHFALLLLDSEAAIIKDVEASGGTLAPALAHYIRHSKPTKSFAQISATSGISLATIQMLASHLVYWRRARAIPPIHQRDTYIVSPNCDLSKLEVATIAYQTAFPTLPSLPKMLSSLSGTPRPYGSFIPSKDHKDIYFSILAWLLRGGWVTQLRTFSRIKVTPEIKFAVELALRKEEVDRYLARGLSTSLNDDKDDQSIADSKNETSSSSSSSLGSHGSGEETPMPGRSDPQAQLRRSHKLLDRSTTLRLSSLIISPHRASPLESRWLDEIVARFPDTAAEEQSFESISPDMSIDLSNLTKKYWPSFLKYFNGHDAMEKIPVRENLKRKLVWQILTRLNSPGGFSGLSDGDPREQVLVSVRHW